ncbi:hypothetical protein TNCV_4811551 [Trichonephila clavipes]|nr:hypothetical protein TNCV_4811551 [Trichonephila clavipes]
MIVLVPRPRNVIKANWLNRSLRDHWSLNQVMDGLFIGLLCEVVSTSATFVFTMDALPDHFLSATDQVSRNRCPKCINADAFCDISPGYFC